MTDLFDRLGQPTFDGIAFPIMSYRLVGAQRKKVHTYPHVNSGKPEKLGRECYVVQVQALFDTSLDARYPGAFPEILNQLLAKFEAGLTGPLFLPTRGTIQAFCEGWTVEMSSAVRSGERADLTFLEDDEAGFSVNDFSVFGANVATKALTLAELRAAYDAELAPADKSLFDGIDDAVNQVRAVQGAAELSSQLVLAKLERLSSLCAEVEDGVALVQDVRAWPLLEATKELWSTAANAANDIANQGVPMRTYTTPTLMALPLVSLAIYGDSARGSSLLDLNFFEDAFAIPPGTKVLYYPDAA
jgi:prophage DNA circulation protein